MNLISWFYADWEWSKIHWFAWTPDSVLGFFTGVIWGAVFYLYLKHKRKLYKLKKRPVPIGAFLRYSKAFKESFPVCYLCKQDFDDEEDRFLDGRIIVCRKCHQKNIINALLNRNKI